ncbi:MAG: hypothetical protein ABMA13_20370 [Chthoniobacteraceae bacterium]
MHRLPIGRSILLLIVATCVGWWWSSRPIRHAPGVLVAEGPVQKVGKPPVLDERNGFQLLPVARYELRGRVLGTKRYRSGIQSRIVPVDVAVGWGRMSDQAVLDQFTLTMGNRFFFYEWRGQAPLARAEIQRSASNNHIIAANKNVAAAVKALRVGALVEMRGWLVDAAGPDGFRWPTSRRREDSGNGACELFYVEEVRSAVAPVAAPM